MQHPDCDFGVILLSEYLLPGYTVSRTHRQSNINGGVVVYTKTCWNSTVTEPTIVEADSLLITINSVIAVLDIYRTPSVANSDNFTTSFHP